MNRRYIAVAPLAAAAAALLSAAPAQAAGALKISKIYYNSPGTDNRSKSSLNAEYVVVTNGTAAPVQLKGYVLSDAENHRYTFGSFTLGKGKSVKVHTGSGKNTATDVYWGSGNYIWNNTKDTATLKKPSGAVVSKASYNSTTKVAYKNF